VPHCPLFCRRLQALHAGHVNALWALATAADADQLWGAELGPRLAAQLPVVLPGLPAGMFQEPEAVPPFIALLMERAAEVGLAHRRGGG
jgi:hypothetical protein